jgi:hypothetical protein
MVIKVEKRLGGRVSSANHRFEFHKRSQLFISPHNETLSVATLRVTNPDRSLALINR